MGAFSLKNITSFFSSQPRSENPIVKSEERGGSLVGANGRPIDTWEGFLNDMVIESASGEMVSSSSAWRLAAVYRSIAVISETIATLPFSLFETRENGNKFLAINHPTYKIYTSEPNRFQTWFDFKLHLVAQALTNGNGYAYIRRDRNGAVLGFEPLSGGECVPYYVKTGKEHYLYYYVFGDIVEARDIIHIKCLGFDGVIGKSPIELARDTIGAGIAQQKFTAAMYKNGLNLKGTLETPAKLSVTALERLKDNLNQFKGASNSAGTLILEEGLNYKAMSLNPVDAQFIESKQYTLEDIARLYGVPQHKIGKLDRSTNNNIEAQDLEFYKNTISPWEERIEQEFNRKVLLSSQKGIYKHEFDNSKLLRTDTKARMEWIQGMFSKGAITPNEIRILEGLNAIDNPKMDETYMQLAMSTVDKLDQNNGSEDGTTNI